jgi:hypothetical protein
MIQQFVVDCLNVMERTRDYQLIFEYHIKEGEVFSLPSTKVEWRIQTFACVLLHTPNFFPNVNWRWGMNIKPYVFLLKDAGLDFFVIG